MYLPGSFGFCRFDAEDAVPAEISGKKIVLFATSGGSGFGKAVENLQPSAPGAQIVEGRILNGPISAEELKAFADLY